MIMINNNDDTARGTSSLSIVYILTCEFNELSKANGGVCIKPGNRIAIANGIYFSEAGKHQRVSSN